MVAAPDHTELLAARASVLQVVYFVTRPPAVRRPEDEATLKETDAFVRVGSKHLWSLFRE